MLFHVTFFSLFTFDPCRGNENKLSHHFRKLLPFLEISVHGHVKLPTPKEVNTPIRRKKNFSLSIEKMDSFLKIFRIQLFSKVLYMSMLLCSSLKFSICDIYNMFCAILTH